MQESNTQINNQPDLQKNRSDLCIDVNLMQTVDFNQERLLEIVRRVLLDHHRESAEISVAVVSDRKIHELNLQFLDHDYETDVLSFNLTEESEAKLTGEIIVSADTATRCAAEHAIPVEDELLLYVIHGTLHLVGYDDQCDQSRAAMRNAERKYVRMFGLQYCNPDEISDTTDGAR